MDITYESSSFRDPKGYIFYYNNNVFRYISESAIPDYEKLINSGLSETLIKKNKLIQFEKDNSIDINQPGIVIKSEKINFISYPYEWCFSQLKDAALLTLDIMKEALKYNLWIKDASAYNVQFKNGKPVFIDILSFESYPDGSPWVAYRQFCQHFLAPLLLLAKTDFKLIGLIKHFIDGIPLDLASKLLPFKTKLSPFINLHIHLHAKMQKKYENKGEILPKLNRSFSKSKLISLLESLYSVIKPLKLSNIKTEWSEYYSFTNYSDNSFEQKKEIISQFIKKVNPKIVWDIGANTGEFSRIESLKSSYVISFDIDYLAVEKNYLYNKKNKITNILPLLHDITNPSPAIGWVNIERKSLLQRCNADLVLALALIHHLAISNNAPLRTIAKMFSLMAKYVIVEFIPKEDSQVKKLLLSREDIFSNYNIEGFERAFSDYFEITDKRSIEGTARTLYLLKTIE